MRQLFTSLTLLLSFSVIAQLDYTFIEFNNVRGTLSNGGVLFNQTETANAGYEVPKSGGNHAIYAMAFWFGGEDINGQLKLAATTYAQEGDFFPGALTVSGDATLPISETDSKGIYKVSRAAIEEHIANYEEMGYTVPAAILEWPAHGDISLDLDFHLAPFVDVDGNGIYEPSEGDYPKIKGDFATYFIVNDKGAIHASGGDPIGLEIHYLVYQYATDDYLNDATYINMRVINRGTQTIYDFKSACFLDTDLGYYDDDFAGFYSDENLMFGYNGGTSDIQYGDNPPAIGVCLLNRDVAKYAPIGNFGATGSPETPVDYYNYMDGKWKDGTSFTSSGNGYGAGTEGDFVYDGLPDDLDSWSEISEGNPSGDRKMMMSTDLGVFSPGDELCFDYVVLYDRQGDHLENVTNLVDLASQAKSMYDSDDDQYCQNAFSGIEQFANPEKLKVFPNPSAGSFQVELEGAFSLQLYALDGRLVYEKGNVLNNEIIRPNVSSGTYIVQVRQEDKTHQIKLVID